MRNKILMLVCFALVFFSVNALCKEIEINSEVLTIDRELDFFIIKSGEASGIEIGDGLIVHRNGKKIAEAYIIEVRQDVSAAEILRLEKGKEINEGDNILIIKEAGKKIPSSKALIPETKPLPAQKLSRQPKSKKKASKWATLGEESRVKPKKKPKSQWATLLGDKSTTAIDSPAIDITYSDEALSYAGADNFPEKVETITLSINNNARTVLSYARLVLRENGFLITSSDISTGIIIAAKAIELSLLRELWADATAAIDHKLVISLEIQEDGNSSVLKLSFFTEHSQKSRHVKRALTKTSKHYSKLMRIASQIKERSE